MESFYGGRQGASFVIKKSFKYIDFEDPAWKADKAAWEADSDNNEEPSEWHIMFKCLNDTTYQDVWYNEYCIIDTINKNNPNNGKIFRRVLKEEDTSLPYEYVGQIVGPSSGAALLNITDGGLEANNARLNGISSDWDTLGFEKENNLVYGANKKDNAYTLKTYSASIENKSLVPGYIKAEKNIYNDEIKYNWFNVRNNTENNDGLVESWCYIGFEIPYTVFTVSATSVGPKTSPSVAENGTSSTHPFWYDLTFNIPRGLPGVSVRRIWKGTLSDKDLNENIYYDATNPEFSLTYDSTNNIYSWKDIRPKSLTKDKPYWLAELLIEQMNETKTITLYLGDVVEIKEMYVDKGASKLYYKDTFDDEPHLVGDLWYPEFKPYLTTAATIDEALAAMPTDDDDLAKGHVYAVSPTNDENSYLVVWDGNEKKWIQLCATGGGGTPAQIQADNGVFTYDNNAKAKGCIKFSNIETDGNKSSLSYFWS